MKSTRDKILQTLLTNPRSTINELATAVNINSISVRHHLASLQAENLVVDEEERHGVGRPRLVYFLTEKGHERFPTKYLRFTTQLLDQLEGTFPESVLDGLFSRMAVNIGSSYSQKASSLHTIEERLNLVKELLDKEGFSVEWEKQGSRYLVNEISCPYYHIGQSHPEICKVDQVLISNILSIPVEKISCILSGDAHCTYAIQDGIKQEAL